MSEVSKVHTGPSIQSNVTHVKGVKSVYRAPQYRAMLLKSEVSKVVFVAVYRVMSLMSEVSKVNSFIYYVRHCMNIISKGMSKVLLKIHYKGS